MEQNSNNIPELQSPFEQLREVDADGKEWWNSRFNFAAWIIEYLRLLKYLTFNKLKNKEKYA